MSNKDSNQSPINSKENDGQIHAEKMNLPTMQKRSRWEGIVGQTFGIILIILGLIWFFVAHGIPGAILFIQGAGFFSLGAREIMADRIMSKIFGTVAIILGLAFFMSVGAIGMGGFFLCILGVMCYTRGKRLCAISAHDLLAHDPRPPVVYLRSFHADKVTSKGTIFGDFKTEEEELTGVLNEIGPVIAIGKPGEELPELGAARLYVGDAEWQQVVHSHLDRAKLVVLRLGDTPGFWWELEHSIKILQPSQLLLIVPFEQKQYNAFRDKVAGHFPHPLPEYVGVGFFSLKTKSGLKSLRSFIYFEPDWTPVFVDIARFRGGLHNKLKCAMRPIFEQLKVTWKPPQIRWGYITFGSLMFPFSLLVPFFLWSKVRHCDGQSRGSSVAARIILALSIFTTIGGVILVFRR